MRTIITMLIVVLASNFSNAQRRLSPPKMATNIESVDQFVDSAFAIYDTVFDFHHGIIAETEATDLNLEDTDGVSPEEDNISDESEEKDEFKILEDSINELINSVPEILEEIDQHSVSKQVKATLSLNRAVKALKQSGKLVKMQLTGA